jgi:hypothetical protein
VHINHAESIKVSSKRHRQGLENKNLIIIFGIKASKTNVIGKASLINEGVKARFGFIVY